MRRSRLPRRDLFLLPLISILTVLVILGGADLYSRLAYGSQENDACLIPDARLGLRYKPNCTSHIKSFESPWVTNHYNGCGYRSDASCGPAPAQVRRVVLLGSSVAMGYLVPEGDTFSERSSEELSRRCGAPVEFQNLGGYLIFWTRVLNRVDDAIRLKPDAALLQLSTYDLERPDPGEGIAAGYQPVPPPTNLLVKLQDFLKSSSAWPVAQHYMFQNEDLYLTLYLRSGSKSAYLRKPLNAFWQDRLDQYDLMLGKIADRFHAAGVPLALVFVPQRAQAELAAKDKPWPNVYPYEVNQELQRIAMKHGVPFIDTTQAVSAAADINDLYYAVDGHLDSAGHRLIAPAIVDGMIADLRPFRDCDIVAKPQIQASQGR